jgi:antitoxin ParD1/3/4
MAYQVPPDVEQWVRDRMAQRGYASEDDVLRDALRALDEVSDYQPDPKAIPITSLDQLRREVARGIEQLNRGEGQDGEKVFEDLLRDLPSPHQG